MDLVDRTRVRAALLALGVVLAVVSLLADPIGIGEGGGFGWKQTLGTIAGVVAAVAGVWLVRARSSRTA